MIPLINIFISKYCLLQYNSLDFPTIREKLAS